MRRLWVSTEDFAVLKMNLERVEFALIANFVHRYPPHGVCAALAIGRPMVELVETICTSVAGKHPQERLSKSLQDELVASG